MTRKSQTGYLRVVKKKRINGNCFLTLQETRMNLDKTGQDVQAQLRNGKQT